MTAPATTASAQRSGGAGQDRRSRPGGRPRVGRPADRRRVGGAGRGGRASQAGPRGHPGTRLRMQGSADAVRLSVADALGEASAPPASPNGRYGGPAAPTGSARRPRAGGRCTGQRRQPGRETMCVVWRWPPTARPTSAGPPPALGRAAGRSPTALGRTALASPQSLRPRPRRRRPGVAPRAGGVKVIDSSGIYPAAGGDDQSVPLRAGRPRRRLQAQNPTTA